MPKTYHCYWFCLSRSERFKHANIEINEIKLQVKIQRNTLTVRCLKVIMYAEVEPRRQIHKLHTTLLNILSILLAFNCVS